MSVQHYEPPTDEHGAMLCCGGWVEHGHQPGCPVPDLASELERLNDALQLARKLIDIPADQILNDTARVDRIKVVVDNALWISANR